MVTQNRVKNVYPFESKVQHHKEKREDAVHVYLNSTFEPLLYTYVCVISLMFLKVGGEISSIVMYQMKQLGRVAVCGSISSYNADARSLPKGSK